MNSILVILLQTVAAVPPAPPVPAPWTPIVAASSATVRAPSREGNGRLAVRCDIGGERVVSVQFIAGQDLGATPPPGRPVSLTIDGATPLISNWELAGRGIYEREDAAVTTITAAFAHAKTIKLHTTNAAGGAIDATFDGPPSQGPIVQVLNACGYTLGQVPVRQPAPADKPAGQ